MDNELEQDIKSHPSIDTTPSGSGYYQLKCPMCGSKQKKAGFNFSSEKIIYSCFRGSCQASCEYEYGQYMFPKFRNLMDELGVAVNIETKVKNKKLKGKTLPPTLYTPHHYKKLELLKDFVDFNADKHWWFTKMMEDRSVDFNRHLYVGTDGDWNHKLIIPCYHNNKLIGWQGINYYKGKTFYLTSSGNGDIMYINNPEGRIVDNPVIVEGIMDAVVIPDAIAIFGNHVSPKQAYILRHCNPILLPDRKGSIFMTNARKYKWRISIPAWKNKDPNSAVEQFGKFVVSKMIHDGITEDLVKAQAKYNMWRFK